MFLCFPKLVGMFRAPSGTSLTFAGLFSLLTLFGTQLHGKVWLKSDLIWLMKAEQICGNLGKSLIFQIEPIIFLPLELQEEILLSTVCWKLKDLFVLLMGDSCLWPEWGPCPAAGGMSSSVPWPHKHTTPARRLWLVPSLPNLQPE